jgi:hypothetical protein
MNTSGVISLAVVLLISGCTAASFVDSVVDGSHFDEPEIKYGEFPFSLTFAVDGDKKTINDTLICQYGGKMVDEGGARNKWLTSYSSGRERVILKTVNINSYIYFPIGSCNTYMDDWPDYVVSYLEPVMLSIFNKTKTGAASRLLDTADAERVYGIKILSWKYAKPIEQPEKP